MSYEETFGKTIEQDSIIHQSADSLAEELREVLNYKPDPETLRSLQAALGIKHQGKWGDHIWSLPGRSLKGELPLPANIKKHVGKVIVDIRVNAAGNVVEASIAKSSTVTNKRALRLARNAAKKAKFTSGDGDVIGSITYIFKINQYHHEPLPL